MDQLVTLLAPHGNIKFVKKGTTIFFQGEIPRCVYVVQNGLAKAYTITSFGEERIVSLFVKGDIFSLPWLLNKSSSTLFYYEAVSDMKLLSIPKPLLLELLETQPVIQNGFFKFVTTGYVSSLLRINALGQSRAAEKIAFSLYYLMFHYGKQTKPDTYVIDLKLTQPMLASLVGLTRESVVINLRQLKRKGIVSFSHFIYTINKPALEKFIGEESFKDLALH